MTEIRSAEHIITHTKRPVLAAFYRSDCAPCSALDPIVDRIGREYTGIVKVLKINVEEDAEMVQAYGIQSVPHLILFKKGKPAVEYPGFLPYASLKELIDRHL